MHDINYFYNLDFITKNVICLRLNFELTSEHTYLKKASLENAPAGMLGTSQSDSFSIFPILKACESYNAIQASTIVF